MSRPTKKQREARDLERLKRKQTQLIADLDEDARIESRGRRTPDIMARVTSIEYGEPEDDVDAAFVKIISEMNPTDPTTTFTLHMWCTLRSFLDENGFQVVKKKP